MQNLHVHVVVAELTIVRRGSTLLLMHANANTD